MNDQVLSSQGLMLQWIIGGVIVCVYAFKRFESPSPTRATTTFGQYWLAKTGYAGSMLLLYLVLGGAGTDLPKPVADLLGLGDAIKLADQAPGPLLAALFLTSLLPNAPVLQKIDVFIKEKFQRFGNIPFEVRELSQLISDADFRPSAEKLAKLAADLDEKGVDVAWIDAPHNTLRHAFARSASLYLSATHGCRPRGFLRFAETHKEELDELTRRFDALRAIEPALLAQLDDDKSVVAHHLAGKVRKDIEDFHEHLCDYVSAGVLETEWSQGQRYAKLVEMGFVDLDRPRPMLGSNEIVLVLGMIFLVLLFTAFATRRIFAPSPLGPNIRMLVLITIVYGIAIVAALHPKATWSSADICRVRTRPVTAYGVSALAAVVAAFFVVLLFRFVFDQSGNLFQTISTPGAFRAALDLSLQRLPWMFMTFSATFAIAWVADDYAMTPAEAPRWLRFAEAGGMSAVFIAAQFVTLELLQSTPAPVHFDHLKLYVNAALVGCVIGAFVPYLYRRSRMNGREPGSGAVEASAV